MCDFRVMAEELTNARAALQRQTREAQTAIQDLLREREEFSQDMIHTHRYEIDVVDDVQTQSS